MDIDKKDIKKLIDQEHEFFFTTYLMSEYHKEKFHWILDTILEKYGKSKEYRIFIYSIVKELIMNGIKANAKKIYAKNYSDKIFSDNLTEKKKEFDSLKEMLSETHPEHENFKKNVKHSNLCVKIYISFNKTGILFVVVNESPLPPQQNLRIRKKLKDTLEYDSVADYFLSGKVDNSEGEGLGMITIFTMMEQFGVNRRYLTFHEDIKTAPIPDKTGDSTAVSFYVPFDKEEAKIYISENLDGLERRKFNKKFWKKYIKVSGS